MKRLEATINRIAEDIVETNVDWVSKATYQRPPKEWGSDYHETKLGWGKGAKKPTSEDIKPDGPAETRINFENGNYKAPSEYMDFMLNEMVIPEVKKPFSQLDEDIRALNDEEYSIFDQKMSHKGSSKQIGELISQIERGEADIGSFKGKMLKDIIKDNDNTTVINSIEDLKEQKQRHIALHDEILKTWNGFLDKITLAKDTKTKTASLMKSMFHSSIQTKHDAQPEPALAYPLGQEDEAIKQKVIEGIEWASKIIDWKKLKSAVSLVKSNESRADYQPKISAIRLTEYAKNSEYIHELGHHIEELPEVHKLAKGFYEKRTRDQPIHQLNILHPWAKYRDDELIRKDSFMDEYTGKIYKDGHTEIVSMGLQHLFLEPIEFRQKDPEHFDLMMKVLSMVKHSNPQEER